jgi:hypothetical protein
MDRLRHEKPDPKMWKRFWYNMTGVARNGDPRMETVFYRHCWPDPGLMCRVSVCDFIQMS